MKLAAKLKNIIEQFYDDEPEVDSDDIEASKDIECTCEVPEKCECGTEDDAEMYEDAQMARHINQKIGAVKDKIKPLMAKAVKLRAKQKEETDNAKYASLEKQISSLSSAMEKYRKEISKLVKDKKAARKKQ